MFTLKVPNALDITKATLSLIIKGCFLPPRWSFVCLSPTLHYNSIPSGRKPVVTDHSFAVFTVYSLSIPSTSTLSWWGHVNLQQWKSTPQGRVLVAGLRDHRLPLSHTHAGWNEDTVCLVLLSFWEGLHLSLHISFVPMSQLSLIWLLIWLSIKSACREIYHVLQNTAIQWLCTVTP